MLAMGAACSSCYPYPPPDDLDDMPDPYNPHSQGLQQAYLQTCIQWCIRMYALLFPHVEHLSYPPPSSSRPLVPSGSSLAENPHLPSPAHPAEGGPSSAFSSSGPASARESGRGRGSGQATSPHLNLSNTSSPWQDLGIFRRDRSKGFRAHRGSGSQGGASEGSETLAFTKSDSQSGEGLAELIPVFQRMDPPNAAQPDRTNSSSSNVASSNLSAAFGRDSQLQPPSASPSATSPSAPPALAPPPPPFQPSPPPSPLGSVPRAMRGAASEESDRFDLLLSQGPLAPPEPQPGSLGGQFGSAENDEGQEASNQQRGTLAGHWAHAPCEAAQDRAGKSQKGAQSSAWPTPVPSISSSPSSWASSSTMKVGSSGASSSMSGASLLAAALPRSASLQSLSDEDCCPTCLEDFTEENPKMVSKCGHEFHLGCIYEWMNRSTLCPVCSKVMEFEESL
eukprot:TRINITY_DN29462_c0_g1_i1.p1 TRINITY_DN29462_c0_g1~~TRINITY_DN29462_c0_g1_i1.p1  ORF type:complete len:451 (+),score=88.98 TRINITY_DN29462_c0_g1_i1:322-1674(+)